MNRLTPSAAKAVSRMIKDREPAEAMRIVTQECERAEKAARESAARIRARAPRAKGATREERKQTKTEANRGEYEKVRERDGGLCQVQLVHVMGKCAGALHIDHQWGRGKEPTKVENCRSLCARHDRMKTENETEKGHSRLMWLCDYREWALSHGYHAEVEKTDGQIALERAQHPEAHRAAR